MPIFSQRSSHSGSRFGSPARIGNAVCGRFRVSLYSGVSAHIGDVLCHLNFVLGGGAARKSIRHCPGGSYHSERRASNSNDDCETGHHGARYTPLETPRPEGGGGTAFFKRKRTEIF